MRDGCGARRLYHVAGIRLAPTESARYRQNADGCIPCTRLRVVGNGTPKSSIIILSDDEKRNRDERETSGAGVAYGPDDMIKRIMTIAATSV